MTDKFQGMQNGEESPENQNKLDSSLPLNTKSTILPEASGRENENELANLAQDIISNVGVGIYIIQEGKFVYVSPLYEKLSGYLQEELINKKSIDYIHPDDRAITCQKAIAALKEKKSQPYEYRFIKKNLDIIWVLEMVASVTFRGKRAVLGSFMDITGRKCMEEFLRQSEDKYRNILENIEDGYFEVDLEGKFTFVNDAVCRVLGYSKEELFGMDNRQYTDSQNEPEVYRVYHQVYKTGESVKEFCWQVINKNGAKKEIAGSISLIRDASGKPIGFRGVARDTTQRKRMEQELKKSELAFRNLFESSPVGIFTIKNRRFMQVNPALCRMTGYLPEELIGQSVRIGYADEENHQLDRKSLLSQLASGRSGSIETRLMKKNGERFDALLYLSSMDPQDFSAGWEGIVMDITEQKQAEEALKSANKQMEDIIEFLPDATVIASEDKRVIAWNRAMEELTGISKMEIIGKPYQTTAIPFYNELLDLAETAGREAVPNYSSVIQIGDVVHAEAFIPSLYQNRGAYVFAAVSPFFDSSGRVVGYIESIRDITKQKQAEDKLHKEEQRFRILTENSSDIILLVNRQGNIIYENTAAYHILGLDVRQRIGASVFDHLHPDDISLVLKTLHLLFADSKTPVQKKELRIRHCNGTWRVFNATASNLVDEKKVDAVIINLRDITEHKHAQEEREKIQLQLTQAQKMESVGRLAGGIAHDFNNMLGVILGRAEIAMTRIANDQPLYKDLQEISKAAERSANLTRQLLAFARRQIVMPRVLDLNETVEGTLKMIRRLIGEDIELVWLPDNVLLPVKMDPGQIDQILANLSINAQDAIEGVGKITIETGTAVFDEAICYHHMDIIPGDFVMLSVSDNGCGMDRETQSKLFEPFFTTKGVGKGTGLGLATVYGIVKQNRGFINVYSEHGRGTTFRIYLPRHSDKAEAPPKENKAPCQQGSEVVLLVEDEPAILEMTTMMLERLGYRVLATGAPTSAIDLAQKFAGKIHLLMTDVVMPEMNGRDLAKNILSYFPNIKRLFMSGYTADVIAHQGVLDEGVHFIQKPFTMNELAAKLRKVLEDL